MEIVLNERSFHITPNHIYDTQFWNYFAEREYEPITQSFMYRELSSKTQFFDIGAAAGSYSLLALSLGSSVVAVEAVPDIFCAMRKNVEDNLKPEDEVELVSAAVAVESGVVTSDESLKHQVLSPIVFTDIMSESPINQIKLIDLFGTYRDERTMCLVKMDIEGSEYKLFSMRENVEMFSKERILIYLSLHPGFMRPPMRLPFVLKFFQRIVRTLWNTVDLWKLHRSVSGKAVIWCNEVKVTSRLRFISLVLLRFYDFVLDFR